MTTPDANAPPEEAFGMTDLEEALRGPDGATVRERVVARLEERRARVAALLDEGTSPEQYAALQKISGALAAASGLMINVRDNSR